MMNEPTPTSTAPLSRTSSFIKQYPELDPQNHLRVLDQHLRESGGSCSLTQALHDHFNSTTNGHSHGTGNSINGRSNRIVTPLLTPPLSPAESFGALYPEPPHLSRPSSPHGSSFVSLPPALSKTSSIEDEHGHHALPTTQLMGKLSIVVVEAKNLRVESGKEKPYVLLQYDRTDSVGREYGAPPPNVKPLLGVPKRGGGINRLNGHPQGLDGKGLNSVRRVGSSSNGSDPHDPTSPLGARPPKLNRRSTTEMSTSTRIVDDSPPVGDPKDIGTPTDPIWNHNASFDVIAPGRTILICVYDKLAPQGGFPAHGFLGASVFEAPLSAETGEDGLGLDIWVPLTSALDPNVGGEVRLRILFENLHLRPKLTVDDFQVLRRIGQGSFGQVFRVRKRDTKRIYAMKVISKKNVVSREALAQVLAERQVLARTLESPFLVGLKFSFQSTTDLFFVIDYKSGGELFQHLQKDGGRFEESKTRFYVAEIVLGLAYLHSQNIVYRDLKPENCLLDGSGHVILCDFGLSKLLDSPEATTRTLCGTAAFTAPEVLLDIKYSFPCDFWSLGCLAYEMCYGFSPFYAENRIEEYERILSGEIKIPAKKGYSPEGRDLLQRLLTREPSERISTDGIRSHAFFESIDWTNLALRQVSPPFKPPTHADEDACDYHDLGRSGHWMFDEIRGCHSARGSLSEANGNGNKTPDEDVDGLFRNFTFTAKEKEKELAANKMLVTERANGNKEKKIVGAQARRSSFDLMP
ncbi:AGC/AKT protein kinase [Microbotryum lychnidis-dioicae p1A1 Lamole]|uniref:AGC/AKT protein kinase n=1 Tax=Microbotryum lychnidis-dioicae (strain p1A1 Lamole / MvSl-1064) TaxID=683840 RepID=U5HJ08_USTV1|nr:AGC/AKT protein kinase [Microbotryum lychnidis-dioicae p1A1 Lamole]|eukprot:KDE02452.1 AGC/AKT protein kinase [Microbotryum lychnidis-dioicae p1A1 Lamole]